MAPKRKAPRKDSSPPPPKRVKHVVPELKLNDETIAALLAFILAHPMVRTKLFPIPGQNPSSAEGGGKPKTHAYWIIASEFLVQLPEYRDAIQLLIEHDCSEARNAYIKKIKNAITRLITKVNKARNLTKQTGAGNNEDEQAEYDNIWEKIREDIPWYDDMAELIGQRPNQVLAGIGNAGNAVDDSVFGPDPNAEADAAPSDIEMATADPLDYKFSSDEEEEKADPKGKGKAKVKSKPSVKVTAMPKKTEATPSKATSTKKTAAVEQRFTELAKEEETTKQAMLDVRCRRMQEEQATRRDRLQLALAREDRRTERARQRHEERMAELSLRRLAYEHDGPAAVVGSPWSTTRDSSRSSTRTSVAPAVPAAPATPVASQPSGSSVTLDDRTLGSSVGSRAPVASGSSTTLEDLSVFESFNGQDVFNGDMNGFDFDFDDGSFKM